MTWNGWTIFRYKFHLQHEFNKFVFYEYLQRITKLFYIDSSGFPAWPRKAQKINIAAKSAPDAPLVLEVDPGARGSVSAKNPNSTTAESVDGSNSMAADRHPPGSNRSFSKRSTLKTERSMGSATLACPRKMKKAVLCMWSIFFKGFLCLCCKQQFNQQVKYTYADLGVRVVVDPSNHIRQTSNPNH